MLIDKLSVTGMYHKDNNEENQDALFFGENKRFTVITLADGVSKCKEGKAGALVAGKALTDLFLRKGDYFIEFKKEQTVDFAISHILYELRKKSETDKKNIEDYSSTIASVLLDKKAKKLLYFSIGDSIIITVKNKNCDIIAKPLDSSLGCCVTTTKGVEKAVKTDIINMFGIDSVLICSDGAWRNMFEMGKLNNEVKEFIINNEHDKLKQFIEHSNSFDDSSFIFVNLRSNEVKTA